MTIGLAGGHSTEANGATPIEGAISADSVLTHLAEIAGHLAQTLVLNPGQGRRNQVVNELLDLALNVSGAHVASCRLITTDEEVHLLSDDAIKWSQHTPANTGKVAKLKHREDCCTRIEEVKGGPRSAASNDAIDARVSRFGGGHFYSEEERAHFRWLGSEAYIPLLVGEGIPKALIVLGHHDGDHFSQERLQLLQQSHGLFTAIFQLADFAQDQIEKAVLFQKILGALPIIASAENPSQFARAVCALVTCGPGFGFHRAMFFRMPNGNLPAECLMAVGGLNDTWPQTCWTDSHKDWSLRDYISNAIKNPIPKNAKSQFDGWYEQGCQNGGLFLRTGESEALSKFIGDGIGTNGGPVLRLTGSDPWVKTVNSQRQKVFANRNDELFVFLLKPIGAREHDPPLGFVLADMPFVPQKHMAGLGFPDLVMTALTLNLIAWVWHFREESNSYFSVLAALPLLRHGGAAIVESVRWFGSQFDGVGAWPAKARESYQMLEENAVKIAQAREIVERRRDRKIVDLPSFLERFVERTLGRYVGRLTDIRLNCNPVPPILLSEEDLETILDCLVHNVVEHGGKPPEGLQCTITVSRKRMSGAAKERVAIVVENNGTPIQNDDKCLLFCDGVSTAVEPGRGSGLSSARLLAKAYRGDVELLDCQPVRFGVLAEPIISDGGATCFEC